MSKKEDNRWRRFIERGTMFPFENISHTHNVKKGVVEVHFIYSRHYLTLKEDVAQRFENEYTNYLDKIERLHL